MTNKDNMNRRHFLAGQVALGVSVAAAAGNAAAATKATPAKATRWETMTATELQRFVGHRFTLETGKGEIVAIKLTGVESSHSGPARPKNLPRPEGLIAEFDSPDKEGLVLAGHQLYRIKHPVLGSADVLLGPVPKRNGGHVLELVLN